MSFKLSNDELLLEIRSKAKHEQKLTFEIIELIREVGERRLFLQLGYSSLFDFVTKDLGYEPSSAMRRIQAARVVDQIPEVKSKIEDGSLSLSVISQVQSFFKREESTKGTKLSKDQKIEILNIVQNKTTREAERELAKLSPEAVKRTESERVISENLTELKIVIDKDLKEQLDELKLLWSHQNPNLTYADLIRLMVKKLNKTKASEGVSARAGDLVSLPAPVVAKRHIPSQVRRYVWTRDQGCCQFKDPSSGRKCQSKYQVQIDHIHRFRDGGLSTPENLRLLCRAHNQWRG